MSTVAIANTKEMTHYTHYSTMTCMSWRRTLQLPFVEVKENNPPPPPFNTQHKPILGAHNNAICCQILCNPNFSFLACCPYARACDCLRGNTTVSITLRLCTSIGVAVTTKLRLSISAFGKLQRGRPTLTQPRPLQQASKLANHERSTQKTKHWAL
jgi:hypothetical protein